MTNSASLENLLNKTSELFSQGSWISKSPWGSDQMTTARKNLLERGLPDRHSEDWKYTNLSFVSNFSGSLGHLSQALPAPFQNLDSSHFQECEKLRVKLNSWQKDSALENLNLLFSETSFLKIQSGEHKRASFSLRADRSNALISPRAVIFLEPNSELTIFEEDILNEGDLLNSFIDISLGEGSKLHYVKIQNNHRHTNQISTVRVLQQARSEFHYYNFIFGSNISRDNVLCCLEGEEAVCDLKGLSVAREGQHLDQFVIVDHRAPRARSNQLFKNVVSSRARAVFNGKVIVGNGCIGTDARQLNRNLLLGKLAEVDTRPQLEIFNDDVKCSHGATIGRLSTEELFYLESRGISKTKAVDLLCRAFVGEVAMMIPDPAARTQVELILNERLSELELGYEI